MSTECRECMQQQDEEMLRLKYELWSRDHTAMTDAKPDTSSPTGEPPASPTGAAPDTATTVTEGSSGSRGAGSPSGSVRDNDGTPAANDQSASEQHREGHERPYASNGLPGMEYENQEDHGDEPDEPDEPIDESQ